MSERGGSHTFAVRRAPILVVLIAVLVSAALLDRIGGRSSAAPAPLVDPVPVAAPASALSSSWFCAGATDGGPVKAPASLVIANSGSSSASGVVTIIGSSGTQTQKPVKVGADASISISEAIKGGSPWVGSIVDVNAGAVAVSQAVSGSNGRSISPCASSGSANWYFPSGETLINAGTEITLLNPYPTDSIIDLTFTTNQGVEQPEDFQGLDVPGGGLLSVNLGTHLRRRTSIATTVTARTGSVVAWETQWVTPPASGAVIVGTAAANNPLADPAAPIPGITVTLGAPSTGTTWTWPDGLAGNGIDEQYVIYNPGNQTAEIRLSVGLAQGQAEPFELSLGPQQVLPVVSEQQARIPAGVAHSAVLTSTNGVGVVAERTVVASPSGSRGTGRSGLGALLGGRIAADQWLVSVALSNSTTAGDLVIYNPGDTSAHVSLYELQEGQQVPLAIEPTVTVAAGQRAAVSLSSRKPLSAPVLVSSDQPVYVESDAYGTSSTGGVSLSLGVPLSP